MSAMATVERVLGWAMSPQGPPPQGDLRDAEALVTAPAKLVQRLAELAAVTAARLGLGASSPFTRSVRMDCLLLAAALGVVREPALVRALLDALPRPEPGEWIVRHAVVGPALPFLVDPVRRSDRDAPGPWIDLIAVSPLSRLWFRPPAGEEGAVLEVLDTLLRDANARRAAIRHLAEPTDRTDVRAFRSDLLERLRLKDPARVIDVYEAMMIHHSERALEQVRSARNTLHGGILSVKNDLLQDALSVAKLWAPLAALDDSMIDALRERHYLGYDYREGVALARLAP